jgi:hypothetical protein
MARSRKHYVFSVGLSVVDGCFSSESDLLQYIRFRLGLRSRDSDNITLTDVSVLNVSNHQEVLL